MVQTEPIRFSRSGSWTRTEPPHSLWLLRTLAHKSGAYNLSCELGSRGSRSAETRVARMHQQNQEPAKESFREILAWFHALAEAQLHTFSGLSETPPPPPK
jgi:hypothetical protein